MSKIVKYVFYNNGGQNIERVTEINFESLKRNVMLNLYYAEMMKMKERATDVLGLIASDLWWECASKEQLLQNRIVIPHFEIMCMLATIYKDGLIETEETDGVCYVKLTASGKEMCETDLSQ